MDIHVVGSVGTAQTKLSAFDAALYQAGVQNFNLIYLSSVIPPQSRIVEVDKVDSISGNFGDRLYVVHADIRSDVSGETIAAGIGWYQFDDGCGLFVEHTLHSKAVYVEEELSQLIRSSLSDLCQSRQVNFDERQVGIRTVSVTVNNFPVCALVLAVYKSESW